MCIFAFRFVFFSLARSLVFFLRPTMTKNARAFYVYKLTRRCSRCATFFFYCRCFCLCHAFAPTGVFSSNFYYLYLGKRRCVQSTGSSFIFVVCHFHCYFLLACKQTARRMQAKEKNNIAITFENATSLVRLKTAYDMGSIQMFFIMTFFFYLLYT